MGVDLQLFLIISFRFLFRNWICGIGWNSIIYHQICSQAGISLHRAVLIHLNAITGTALLGMQHGKRCAIYRDVLRRIAICAASYAFNTITSG